MITKQGRTFELIFCSAAAGDGGVEPIVLTDCGKRDDDASPVRVLPQAIRESRQTHAAPTESACTGT